MKNKNFEISSAYKSCIAPTHHLFQFLSDINNLEKILPKDKTNNFQAKDNQRISFAIESIITLTLYIQDKYLENISEKSSYINYRSEHFGDYYLELKAEFLNNQSKIILSGYLNPFVLSIAKNKLTHLVERINHELSLLEISGNNLKNE